MFEVGRKWVRDVPDGCSSRVDGAWASAEVKGTYMGDGVISEVD